MAIADHYAAATNGVQELPTEDWRRLETLPTSSSAHILGETRRLFKS
jgi:hypothetical protein